MLQIQNLTIRHRRDLRTLINDMSFTLNAGDKAVVIGEEGDGKSTMLKWIYDPHMIEDYAEAEGLQTAKGERLAYIPQELPADCRTQTVFEHMQSEPLFAAQSPAWTARTEKELGLGSGLLYSDRLMETLSGGEKVKVQIARLLSAEPSVLLLDEPSNDIDIETLEWLESFISKAPQAILYVSHDETLIEGTATRVIHLEQLRRRTETRATIANIPYAEYIERRSRAISNQARLAKEERRAARERDERWRRIYQSVEYAQNTITRADPASGRLLKKKMHAVKSMARRFERERGGMTEYPSLESEINIFFADSPALPAGKTVLDLRLPVLLAGGLPEDGTSAWAAAGAEDHTRDRAPVSAAAGGADAESRVLARNIELFVRGPEKVCITGRNGAGKTTLIRIIAGELLDRSDIKAAYMPQDYAETLDFTRPALEILAPGGSREERGQVSTRLAALRFAPEDMMRPAALLSGGQRAKLLLLRLVLAEPEVLILDEPTRNFSPLSGPVVRRILAGFSGAIISVSHDRKFISEVADRVLCLEPDGLRLLDRS